MESCNFNGNKLDKSDIRSFQKAGKALLYVYTYLPENKEA